MKKNDPKAVFIDYNPEIALKKLKELNYANYNEKLKKIILFNKSFFFF